ncbi:hypothetical protein M407DRAFT_25683 [Tulasnella calospora MUT 4182]|uniref:Uncharacterized protein n=1 Tax=Tulasnella calospora MUT 4182 TaxID=1051891 RepID=A0A0C3KTY0_9AGAM|nr:hypothetical protein M407DRAFT_25683 [Tulasnella calospora MUT 4182]
MAQRLAQLLILLVAICCCLVKADQTIVVDGQDQSIQYHTVQSGDGNATWTRVERSPDSCDTPQMLTSRIGDYMTFTFTGTGVQVVGTIGKKRGLIQFALDGQNTTLKDRSNQQLACDSVLYQVTGLPNQQHTVMATLVGKDINFSSGAVDGFLLVDTRFRSRCVAFDSGRYYIPGGGGSSNVGAIAGGVVAGILALVAAGVGYWWYLRRKKQQNQDPRRASAGAFIDSDDVPGHLQGKAASPGLIATPFEWNGPGSQFGGTPGTYHAGLPGGVTPTTESGTLVASPNNPPSSYFQPASSSNGRTNTYSMSSISDVKRDSNLAGTPGVGAALGYGVTHPDSPETIMASPRTSVHPGGDQRASAVIDETHLVDRIANRLADIMTTRTGGVGVLDQIAPPPMYSGPAGPGGPAPPPQQQSPPPNAGSPGAAPTALPYPTGRDSAPTQLAYAQYPYQSSSPPPRNESYPGSNRF